MSERKRTSHDADERADALPSRRGTSVRDEAAPDLASRIFVAELILSRVDDLRRNLPYLHDPKDIEHVHQVRVACRRLRTAFTVFEGVLPGKAMRRWSRHIRQLGGALGGARDLDVQIEFLDRFLKRLDEPRHKPGLERLRLRLTQKRRRAQRRLRRKLAKFERSVVGDELDHAMRSVIVEGRLAAVQSEPRFLWSEAERRITDLIGELLLHEQSVTKPDRVEDHHQIRIAAKHLRYALEAFGPLYEGELQPATVSMRQLQKVLGDLHDCDVWIERLPAFLHEERKRTKRFFGHARGFGRVASGIEALLEDRIAARGRIHAAFVDQWQQECGDAVWDSLRATLRRITQLWRRTTDSAAESSVTPAPHHDASDGDRLESPRLP